MLSACVGDSSSTSGKCVYPEAWIINPPPSDKVVATILREGDALYLNGNLVDESKFSNELRVLATLDPSPLFLVKLTDEQPCDERLKILREVDRLVRCARSNCGITSDFDLQLLK